MTCFFLQNCCLVPAIPTLNNFLILCFDKVITEAPGLPNAVLSKIVYPQWRNKDYLEFTFSSFSPALRFIIALRPHTSKSEMDRCLERFYQGLCPLFPIRDSPDSALLKAVIKVFRAAVLNTGEINPFLLYVLPNPLIPPCPSTLTSANYNVLVGSCHCPLHLIW